jgi:phage terminase small subunit
MKKAIAALKPATKRWVHRLRREYVLEDRHIRLLVAAGRLWDQAEECRSIIEKEGSLAVDRFGQTKAHPAVEMERVSLIGFSKLLREVGLDLSRPDDPRPPSRPGGY